jgi:hypothetical protein
LSAKGLSHDGDFIQLWPATNGDKDQIWLVQPLLKPQGVYAIESLAAALRAGHPMMLDCHFPCKKTAFPQLWEENSKNEQLWVMDFQFEHATTIKSFFTGNTYLDSGPNGPFDGKNPHMWTFNGSDFQLWSFRRQPGP